MHHYRSEISPTEARHGTLAEGMLLPCLFHMNDAQISPSLSGQMFFSSSPQLEGNLLEQSLSQGARSTGTFPTAPSQLSPTSSAVGLLLFLDGASHSTHTSLQIPGACEEHGVHLSSPDNHTRGRGSQKSITIRSLFVACR